MKACLTPHFTPHGAKRQQAPRPISRLMGQKGHEAYKGFSLPLLPVFAPHEARRPHSVMPHGHTPLVKQGGGRGARSGGKKSNPWQTGRWGSGIRLSTEPGSDRKMLKTVVVKNEPIRLA